MRDIFDPDAAQFLSIDGLSVRVVRSTGNRDIPVLLTSPYPETVHAFSAIWPSLTATDRQIVAIDLPGFGRSEGRPELMSPSAMGGFLPAILDALALDRVHAVVPDVGTLAALFAASAQPDRFESIVGGSGGAAMDLLGPHLRQIAESVAADFARHEGGAQVMATVSAGLRWPAQATALEDYRRGAVGQRWNEAAAFVRAYPRDLPRLATLLPAIEVPVLIVSGTSDPWVPPANGDFLADALPHVVAERVDAGHFVWEDAPEAYSQLLIEWIDGRYRAVARRP